MTEGNQEAKKTGEKSNEKLRAEMSAIQQELREAIEGLMEHAGKKLKPQERAEIQEEFDTLNEYYERLKLGRVWISLFGKTSAGKSALGNSLLGKDLFKVSVLHNLTTETQHEQAVPESVTEGSWEIVDVPGIMGDQILEELALDEAKKAHGIIFVLDGEPYGPELKLFDIVHKATPQTPKFVFVNKMDSLEAAYTEEEIGEIKGRVSDKMQKYVGSPEDIVYGSALPLDKVTKKKTRQPLPQLEARLYDQAGLLGDMMNIINPAGRAEGFGLKVSTKLLEVRMRASRTAINAFALASTAGGFVPFGDLLLAPGLLGGLVFTMSKLMGQKLEKENAKEVAKELLKVCGQVLVVDFAALTAVAVVADTIGVILGPIGVFLSAGAGGVALGVWRFRRTVIFGEVVLEYLKRGFSWGGEDREKVIRECKERALKIYGRGSKPVAATN